MSTPLSRNLSAGSLAAQSSSVLVQSTSSASAPCSPINSPPTSPRLARRKDSKGNLSQSFSGLLRRRSSNNSLDTKILKERLLGDLISQLQNGRPDNGGDLLKNQAGTLTVMLSGGTLVEKYMKKGSDTCLYFCEISIGDISDKTALAPELTWNHKIDFSVSSYQCDVRFALTRVKVKKSKNQHKVIGTATLPLSLLPLRDQWRITRDNLRQAATEESKRGGLTHSNSSPNLEELLEVSYGCLSQSASNISVGAPLKHSKSVDDLTSRIDRSTINANDTHNASHTPQNVITLYKKASSSKAVVGDLCVDFLFTPLPHFYLDFEELFLEKSFPLMTALMDCRERDLHAAVVRATATAPTAESGDVATASGPAALGGVVVDVSSVIELLLVLFEGNGRVLELMEHIIAADVAKTPSNNLAILLRDDHIATRLFCSYMARVGRDYTRDIVHPLVHKAMGLSDPLELNPERCLELKSKPDLIKKRTDQLASLARMVIEQVSASTPPLEMLRLFRFLAAAVEEKFPKCQHFALGSVLFLRLLCPTIVSPHQHGVISDMPSPAAQRTLVLVAKILQTLANMSLFGDKESYMTPMNAFIQSSMGQLEKFYSKILSEAPSPMQNCAYVLPEAVYERIAAFMLVNRDVISSSFKDSNARERFAKVCDTLIPIVPDTVAAPLSCSTSATKLVQALSSLANPRLSLRHTAQAARYSTPINPAACEVSASTFTSQTTTTLPPETPLQPSTNTSAGDDTPPEHTGNTSSQQTEATAAIEPSAAGSGAATEPAAERLEIP